MAIRKVNYDAIANEMKNLGQKPATKTFEKKVDENLYIPKLKDGMSTVLLRFLPPPENDIPLLIAEEHRHAVKRDDGKWLICRCPKTVSKTAKCPICDEASLQWKAGNQALAKKLFKTTKYFVNVLIINDINNPENNGKIFVMRIGKKLLTKINTKMYPSETDIALGEEAVNVFDYESGLNFKLVVKEIEMKNEKTGLKETQINYDSSEWSKAVTRIGADPKKPYSDKEIDELVEKNLVPLKPYVEAEAGATFESLKKRVDWFFGRTSSGPVVDENPPQEDDSSSTEDFIKNMLGQN